MRHPLYLLTASTGQVPADRYLLQLRHIDCVLALKVPKRVDCFDGLLLLGGRDAHPSLYGQPIYNDTVELDEARDALDITLIQMFCAAGKPIFGICRGIQMLNVALGGTLVQDLPEQRGLNHSGGVRHMVTHVPGSFAHVLWGDTVETNSYHHQAIDRLASGLQAVSFAPDGVIEAVQHDSLPIAAVQWHPELDPVMPDFFRLLQP